MRHASGRPQRESEFVIEAPVALNSNHLRTAFGGSINAVATLAAYGLLWLGMRDPAVHVVVAESRIRFLRPVRETIRAICPRPSPDEWAAFRNAVLRERARPALPCAPRSWKQAKRPPNSKAFSSCTHEVDADAVVGEAPL